MNWLPHFMIQSIVWYDGLDEFIFFFYSLEKTAFDLLTFC